MANTFYERLKRFFIFAKFFYIVNIFKKLFLQRFFASVNNATRWSVLQCMLHTCSNLTAIT